VPTGQPTDMSGPSARPQRTAVLSVSRNNQRMRMGLSVRCSSLAKKQGLGMPIRNELSHLWGNGVLPHKIRAWSDRCRPYVGHGSGHFLMYVFGRFGLVRSCMVSIYSRKASKALLNLGPSLVEDVDVEPRCCKYSARWLFLRLEFAPRCARRVPNSVITGNLFRRWKRQISFSLRCRRYVPTADRTGVQPR
jgi:hypothetical protein